MTFTKNEISKDTTNQPQYYLPFLNINEPTKPLTNTPNQIVSSKMQTTRLIVALFCCMETCVVASSLLFWVTWNCLEGFWYHPRAPLDVRDRSGFRQKFNVPEQRKLFYYSQKYGNNRTNIWQTNQASCWLFGVTYWFELVN